MRVDRFGRVATLVEEPPHSRYDMQQSVFHKMRFAYNGSVWGVALTQDWTLGTWLDSEPPPLLTRYLTWQITGISFSGPRLSSGDSRPNETGAHLLQSVTGITHWQAWHEFMTQVCRVEARGV